MFLRARYLDPAQGRFLTRDEWEGDYNAPLTLNRWNYTQGNPVNATDPSGKCEDHGDEECWRVYQQIILLCPDCAVTMTWPPGSGDLPLSHANISYLRTVLKRQQLLHSANPDREDFAQQNADLLGQVMPLIKDQANQFGIPWQIAAGIFDTERQLDWNWQNEQREWGYAAIGAWSVLNLHLSRTGNNPGAGIANIHADTARKVAQYFSVYIAENACLYWEMPISPDSANLDVVMTLESRENNIRIMTADIRMMADFRFGSDGKPSKTSHANLADWRIEDAVAIWHGYRYGIPDVSPKGQGNGFRNIEDFQKRTIDLYRLINEVIIGNGNPQQSASEAVPILEKYMRLP